MTKRVNINQCLETDCQNDGGTRLLCAEHLPAYQPANDPGEAVPAVVAPFTDDVQPDQREQEILS